MRECNTSAVWDRRGLKGCTYVRGVEKSWLECEILIGSSWGESRGGPVEQRNEEGTRRRGRSVAYSLICIRTEQGRKRSERQGIGELRRIGPAHCVANPITEW